MFKAAIFDMDGTILESMGMWENIGASYLISVGKTPREGLRKELIPLTLYQSALYFREHYGVELTDEEILGGFDALLKDFYGKTLELKPGALEFLNSLKQRGVKMCLATATERYLTEAAMERLGLTGYFEFIITCSEAGFNKRTPEIFDICVERLGVSKDEAIIFEDAVHAIRCAKENGYLVCAVRDFASDAWREEIEELADFSVDRLDELNIDAL